MLNKKEAARYRAILRRKAKLTEGGWTPENHPDFEFLDAELVKLSEKMTKGELK